jgi:hypothetical protein
MDTDGQSSVDAATFGVLKHMYFCCHPEVVETRGDKIHPVPIDDEFLKIANVRYRHVKRNSAWDRTPRSFYLTDNVFDTAVTYRALDDQAEIADVIDMQAMQIQAQMQKFGIKALSEATAEQREIILGIRDASTEERAYEQRKIEIYSWLKQQLWDIGCSLGADRSGADNDTADLALKNVSKRRAL